MALGCVDVVGRNRGVEDAQQREAGGRRIGEKQLGGRRPLISRIAAGLVPIHSAEAGADPIFYAATRSDVVQGGYYGPDRGMTGAPALAELSTRGKGERMLLGSAGSPVPYPPARTISPAEKQRPLEQRQARRSWSSLFLISRRVAQLTTSALMPRRVRFLLTRGARRMSERRVMRSN